MQKAKEAERRLTIKYFGIAALIIGALWAWYVLEHTTDLRLQSRLSPQRTNPNPIDAEGPLFFSGVAAVVAFFLWSRVAGIGKHGAPATATVTFLSGPDGGTVMVEFRYTWEGKEYSRIRNVPTAKAAGLQVGSPLPIILNAKRPGQCIVA